jgi:hypothetical protein
MGGLPITDPEIIRWTGMILVIALVPPLLALGFWLLFKLFKRLPQ